MINVRRSEERGHFDHGWLNTYHTFSFADYYDPAFTGFRTLRVINEDRVAPQTGFGTHGHRDMEIVTYVISGALEHHDSMGNGSTIRPGEVQRMSAGTGVRHSEANASESEPVHFLQIWILPESDGIRPSYEQKRFDEAERLDRLRLVASRDGRDGSVTIHQDVALYAALLRDGATVRHDVAPNRYGWLQIVRGSVDVNGQSLSAGDGAAIANERAVEIQGEDAEILLFDLS